MSPRLIALESAPKPAVHKRIPVFLVIGFVRVLVRLGPQRMQRFMESVKRGARPASMAEAKACRDLVVGTSMRCAGPRCLERSVATALLCRLRGSWPQWRTGVALQPFQAHAWVEAEGRPVSEPEREIALFTVTMSVAVES